MLAATELVGGEHRYPNDAFHSLSSDALECTSGVETALMVLSSLYDGRLSQKYFMQDPKHLKTRDV